MDPTTQAILNFLNQLNPTIVTIFNVLTTEISFLIGEQILKRKHFILGAITTIILFYIVVAQSLGLSIYTFVTTDTSSTLQTTYHLGLLTFNVFYTFFRGLKRIQGINKKYGNL